MNQRFNLIFYLKKPKKYEEGGLMPVYIRVSVAGKRTEFATQREWDPTKWMLMQAERTEPKKPQES